MHFFCLLPEILSLVTAVSAIGYDMPPKDVTCPRECTPLPNGGCFDIKTGCFLEEGKGDKITCGCVSDGAFD